MTWQEAVEDLSVNTARAVGQLWTAVESGALPLADFKLLVVDLIAAANLRGQLLAAAAFRALLEAADGLPYAAAVPATASSVPRLTRALETILGEEKLGTRMQLERMARNEPAAAAVTEYGEQMKGSRRVQGWVRVLDADPCPLCIWLRKEHLRPGGYIYPATSSFHRHVGCCCVQQAVTTTIQKETV